MKNKDIPLITRGIRKLPRHRVQVHLEKPFGQNARASVAVIARDGSCELVKISRKLAEVLIAGGMAYEN